MSKNHVILLDQALAEYQERSTPPLPRDIAFELLTAEQILKDYDLSPDEIESGRVGGARDGGLDGIYVFLGDALLAEDDDIFLESKSSNDFSRNSLLTLWLIQAKNKESFEETPFDKAQASLRKLLEIDTPAADLLEQYAPEVVTRIRMFTQAWKKLATRKPRVRVRFTYATKGDRENANKNVLLKMEELRLAIAEKVYGAEIEVDLAGAEELWNLYNTSPSYSLKLRFQENASPGSSHVALVHLNDYWNFLVDEKGELRKHIFDSNVRDYQGDVEVNKEIRDSLENPESPEFWWMNNGATIICSSATINGKEFVLDDVQVVNGLQTSYTVYEVLRSMPTEAREAQKKSVLVRILVTTDDATSDKVIRATNRQTSVPDASLRATDEVQRKIEAHFFSAGWYYDRRKNYYRNIGKSADRIISIPLLGQAVMAIGLSQPNDSRARPSSLLKKNDEYSRIFSEEIPLPVYLWIARLQKYVDNYLMSGAIQVSSSQRTNLRFHVSMLAVARKLGKKVNSPLELRRLAEANAEIGEQAAEAAFTDVNARAASMARQKGWALDRTAKSKDLVARIFAEERWGR
ncbi:AIPR family protein [Amycolatopsis sp. NPDC101161]|uniref:AIPR family protein n=1 Tax=Amycolatopsis sp. NPDC101161 TaxID=3363940 RepID=UPI00380ADFA6